VARPCPSCGTANDADARFCGSCGSSLSAICARCGATLPSDARFCPSCGHPAPGTSGPAEERKLATLLFVDLVGSTSLAEPLDPERLRAVLGSYFAEVSTTIAAWGGTVEKYIGDAVVAVFGVPRVRDDDATRAVSAAVEVLERIEGLNRDLAARGDPPLAVRIGVNTGEVVAPSEIRPDQTLVTGDAVNVAARLEQAAAPGTVLVGRRTAQLAANAFRFGPTSELAVKGRQEPVAACLVEGRIVGGDTVRATRLRTRMVGRDHEMAALEGVLDETIESGAPRLAVVVGPPGIGKSRLVREFVGQAAAERPDCLVLRGRCPPAGQGASLWPFAEVVRAACGISLDDSSDVAETKLRTAVEQIGGRAGLGVPDTELMTFALATTTGVALAGNPLDALRAGPAFIELMRQWPRFVSLLAVGRPVVLVVEDIHWASENAIEILTGILRRATNAVAILTTARPEFFDTFASFAGMADVTSVTVQPLGSRAGRVLLTGLLSTDSLTDSTVATILANAEGNPLFVEELLAGLIERGALVQESDGRWRVAGAGPELIVPDTIQGVLGARIDALPADEKRVLQEAAVVGRQFWKEPIEQAIGGGIEQPLGRLEQRGLVALRPTSSLAGHDEYAIKHALLRDVAYASLSRGRRSRAHAQVAAWLGEIAADHPEELAEIIAAHDLAAIEEGFERAWDGDPEGLAAFRGAAFEALLAGGTVARKRYAPERGLQFHEAALRIASDDVARARAQEEIGDDHDIAYHGDLAVPAWTAALNSLGTQPSTAAARARLAYKIGFMGTVRWGGFATPMDPAVIDEIVNSGLAAAGEDEGLRAPLLAVRAGIASRWAAFGRTDPVPSAERAANGESAQAYARAAGDPTQEVVAQRALVGVYALAGDRARTTETARRLLETAAQVETSYTRHLFTMIGAQAVAWLDGRFQEVLDVGKGLLAIGRETQPHDVLHSTCLVMSCLYHLGRWDDFPAVIEEHERTFAVEADMACPYVRGGMMLGALFLARRGDRDRAADLIARVPLAAGPIGFGEGLQAMAIAALGDASAARELAARTLAAGRRNPAEEPPVELLALLDATAELGDVEALERAIATSRERAADLILLAPASDLAEGRLAASRGETDRAVRLLRSAVRGFDRLSRYDAARARLALAAVTPLEREELVAAARATFVALGAEPDERRVDAALAGASPPT
jgi:class 3 adenylate cyclase